MPRARVDRSTEDNAQAITVPPKGYGVRRATLNRTGVAVCETCGEHWTESWSIVRGVQHVEATGHSVVAQYSSAYRYARTRPADE